MALEPGASSDDVLRMQQQLASMGFQPPINGSYDEATTATVAQFQQHFEMSATGTADDDTLAAIQDRIDAGFGEEDYGQLDYESPDTDEVDPPTPD